MNTYVKVAAAAAAVVGVGYTGYRYVYKAYRRKKLREYYGTPEAAVEEAQERLQNIERNARLAASECKKAAEGK